MITADNARARGSTIIIEIDDEGLCWLERPCAVPKLISLQRYYVIANNALARYSVGFIQFLPPEESSPSFMH